MDTLSLHNMRWNFVKCVLTFILKQQHYEISVGQKKTEHRFNAFVFLIMD